MPKHKFSLVACARWEADNILEWLDYHKTVGFDHVYLWSNDDEPETLRRAIEPHLTGPDPFVTFNFWPVKAQQFHIYERFLELYAQETEWFSFLDVDEFLVMRGVNDIGRFMQPLDPMFDCIYFHWANFGANGRVTREPGSVLTGLTRRERRLDFHTKNLVRSSKVSLALLREGLLQGALPYHHFWDDYRLPDFRVGNVLGESITGYTEDFPIKAHAFTHRPGYQDRILNHAYCAHFRFKSEADFMRRVKRGGGPNQQLWAARVASNQHKDILLSHSEVQDRYLADFWGPHQQLLDAVRWAQQTPRASAAPMFDFENSEAMMRTTEAGPWRP
jgi:hypothetical protein